MAVNYDLADEMSRLLIPSSIDRSGPPKAVILAGGVAVGKTTARRNEYSQGYVVIDSAEIFHHLSRGNSEIDFPGPLQEAVEEIGSLVTLQALTERRNVVTEIIGDKLKPTQELIDSLTAIGYKVEVKLLTCDLQESLRRAADRGDNVSAYYAQHFQHRWIVDSCKELVRRATPAAPDAQRQPQERVSSGESSSSQLRSVFWGVYIFGNIATFIKLTFFDGYAYNWWNWIIAIAVNEFLALIWPIYWVILRPLFGQ